MLFLLCTQVVLPCLAKKGQLPRRSWRRLAAMEPSEQSLDIYSPGTVFARLLPRQHASPAALGFKIWSASTRRAVAAGRISTNKRSRSKYPSQVLSDRVGAYEGCPGSHGGRSYMTRTSGLGTALPLPVRTPGPVTRWYATSV